MTDNLIRLASHNPAHRVRACATCQFLMRDKDFHTPLWWRCGIGGRRCQEEMHAEDGCGPGKLLWAPAPPPRPGFWTRFGDALIAWIDRMDRYEKDT